MRYTEEETEKLKQLYLELGNDGLNDIAAELNRPVKSIIAKLAILGIYEKKIYLSKIGELPETKKQIVEQLEEEFNVTLLGLEKADKRALRIIRDLLLD